MRVSDFSLSKFSLKCVPRNADPLEFRFYRFLLEVVWIIYKDVLNFIALQNIRNKFVISSAWLFLYCLEISRDRRARSEGRMINNLIHLIKCKFLQIFRVLFSRGKIHQSSKCITPCLERLFIAGRVWPLPMGNCWKCWGIPFIIDRVCFC